MRDPKVEEELQKIRAEFGSPEEINDDPNTAPSKRIANLFPSYRKPLHGVLAAKRITIDVIRGECPHFDEWLTTLEKRAVVSE
jgi:hypothetical protein